MPRSIGTIQSLAAIAVLLASTGGCANSLHDRPSHLCRCVRFCCDDYCSKPCPDVCSPTRCQACDNYGRKCSPPACAPCPLPDMRRLLPQMHPRRLLVPTA